MQPGVLGVMGGEGRVTKESEAGGRTISVEAIEEPGRQG